MTLVMGIVNVTPDSFSDGGRFVDPDTAIAHGLRLRSEGADILDIGGESTRPGAERVAARVEQQRVLPVVAALAAAGAVVSIDTLNAETAIAAVEAGARIVNDVSGGLADPAMLEVVAATDADAAGDRYAVKLAELALQTGVRSGRIKPPGGCRDWNEVAVARHRAASARPRPVLQRATCGGA